MSDDMVKRICQKWIDAGYADECFCQIYPGCSAKGNSLTPRMVFDRIQELEAKLREIEEEWEGAIYGDLESGVASLNRAAWLKLQKDYPLVSSFGDTIDRIIYGENDDKE